jgi:hypothetical protein
LQPKLSKWAYPTDEDVVGICPTDDKNIALDVTPAALYGALSQFDGMFQSAKWRYSQVRVATNKASLTTDNELLLHFDDMAAEVREYLPITNPILTDIDSDDFEFILPSLHIARLESILKQSPVIHVLYNDIESSEPNGLAIRLYTDKLSLVIAKLLD